LNENSFGEDEIQRVAKIYMNPTSEVLIIRVKDRVEEEVVDRVASETAFTLQVNGQTLVSLLCSPFELDTMAMGFLLSEGILRDRQSLRSIRVDEQTSTVFVEIAHLPADWEALFHRRTITSGCGQGVTFSRTADLKQLARRKPIRLCSGAMQGLLRQFRNISELYVKTGGVHSAAFSNGREILLFSEDIGRHNAVDKLIGKAFLQGMAMEDKILLSSGRISGEIMIKVIRNRIPVLISRTAPTCMSITHAENHGVTLIGFARGDRMNIYTHPQNLETSPC
jgi:FdhD protein